MQDNYYGNKGIIYNGDLNVELNNYNSSNEIYGSIYNHAKFIPVSIQEKDKIVKSKKFSQIATLLSAIASIISSAVTYSTEGNFILIIILTIFYILTFVFIIDFIKHNNFFKSLSQKGYAYTNGNIYLNNTKGKLFKVAKTKCPYCKNRKSMMRCKLEDTNYEQNLNSDKASFVANMLKRNIQEEPLFFVCETNPKHIIEIDWTQFDIPED